MTEKRIWQHWRYGKNTLEIAKLANMKEHEVHRIISRCLDAIYCNRPMPRSRLA